MADHNERFIQTVQIDEIPWHRITTTYARATDFPKYFNVLWQMSDMKEVDKAGREIEINIEHQSTLWHVTPFAMIFLVRIFKKAVEKMENSSIATYLEEQLLELFIEIAEAICSAEALEHEEPLPNFSDMLNEEYLWSEEYDEEIDALRYEEEDVFPRNLFYSFYYYSHQVILQCKPMFEKMDSDRARVLCEKIY